MARIKQIRRILDTELKNVQRGFRNANYKPVGKSVVNEMKNLIGKGISPIRGEGRFPRYKNTEVYPGRVRKKFPSKRNRPVNLNLSGQQIRSLTFRIRKGLTSTLRVGYFNRKAALKESGHRDGVNAQPKRPTIPSGTEQFAVRVKRVINREIFRISRKIVNRSL